MASYQHPGGEDDPVYLIRAIGRLAQMLLEIRDEYVNRPDEDTLNQFERRLDEIGVLHAKLRELRPHGADLPTAED